MKKFILLFLLLCSSIYGYKQTDNCSAGKFEIKVIDCIQVKNKHGRFDYFLISDHYSYEIKSVNEYMTTKLAAFIKTKVGQDIQVQAHYHYYKMYDGTLFFTLMQITNAYK